MTSGFHFFHKSEIHTAPGHSYNFHNLQPILDYNIQKFALKYHQYKNGKTRLVSLLIFILFSNKRAAFFSGHQVEFIVSSRLENSYTLWCPL